MRLEVRDPVIAALSQRTAAAVPGVARLHDVAWRPSARGRSRGRGVEVERTGDGVIVTVRLVVGRGRPVIDVVRTVQQSVQDELLRRTGLAAEVVVIVVDLD